MNLSAPAFTVSRWIGDVLSGTLQKMFADPDLSCTVGEGWRHLWSTRSRRDPKAKATGFLETDLVAHPVMKSPTQGSSPHSSEPPPCPAALSTLGTLPEKHGVRPYELDRRR